MPIHSDTDETRETQPTTPPPAESATPEPTPPPAGVKESSDPRPDGNLIDI